MLRNCDPEASMEARKYDYMEANACSCQICSSVDTSCESPQALQKGSGSINRLTGTELDLLQEEDYSLIAEKN